MLAAAAAVAAASIIAAAAARAVATPNAASPDGFSQDAASTSNVEETAEDRLSSERRATSPARCERGLGRQLIRKALERRERGQGAFAHA